MGVPDSAAADSGNPLPELPTCKDSSDHPLVEAARAEPAVKALPGGGRKFTYSLPGVGVESVTFTEPPAGFEPTSASDKELQDYGFPSRPSNESGIAEWRELVQGYESVAPPTACRGPQVPGPHSPAGGVERVWESGNWSGYVASKPSNTSEWHAVIGNFYQPSGTQYPSCKSNARLVDWVGMGGFNSERFIQTGTETSTSGTYLAWIEWWQGLYHESINLTGFNFTASNYIRLYAGYNASQKIAYFYITNDWTGQTVLTEIKGFSSQFYDGSSVEWIDERPGVAETNNLYPLLNYNVVNWYSNTAQNASNQVLPISSLPHGKIKMAWNTLLSVPGDLWNGQNFTEYYKACQ
jgi:hypothetical protein